MILAPRIDRAARRALAVAAIAAGLAIGAASRGHDQLALFAATIAAAATLSVLRHLLNQENAR